MVSCASKDFMACHERSTWYGNCREWFLWQTSLASVQPHETAIEVLSVCGQPSSARYRRRVVVLHAAATRLLEPLSLDVLRRLQSGYSSTQSIARKGPTVPPLWIVTAHSPEVEREGEHVSQSSHAASYVHSRCKVIVQHNWDLDET